MADTCIVCLGELATITTQQQSVDHTNAAIHDTKDINADGQEENELVAHLLPCGHNLHDVCLRPWVERANSCPICRATFNEVKVSEYINGPAINSYPVQDKIQTAVCDEDFHLSAALLSSEEDEHIDPCMVCDFYGDESQLLLCDGCNQSCHVFCAGLDHIPIGAWFCFTCQADTQLMRHGPSTSSTSRQQQPYAPSLSSSSSSSRQPRAARPAHEHILWMRLWRSVANRTGIDLEHPFDDNDGFLDDEDSTALLEHQPSSPTSPLEGPLDYIRRHPRRSTRQRNHSQLLDWERRFQVAASVAGLTAANRFRNLVSNTAAAPTTTNSGSNTIAEGTAANTSPPSPTTSTSRIPVVQKNPESQDEIRAWNSFEKARQLQDHHHIPGRQRRKRKSRPSSPAPERSVPLAARSRKRPRLLRPQDDDTPDDTAAESSTSASNTHTTTTETTSSSSSSTLRLRNATRVDSTSDSAPTLTLSTLSPTTTTAASSSSSSSLSGTTTTTFLQSLLNEVESRNQAHQDYAARSSRRSTKRLSSGSTSPSRLSAYPVDEIFSSNPPSPTSQSSSSRSVSPHLLSSRIEPVYGPRPSSPSPSPRRAASPEPVRGRSEHRLPTAAAVPSRSPVDGVTRARHDSLVVAAASETAATTTTTTSIMTLRNKPPQHTKPAAVASSSSTAAATTTTPLPSTTPLDLATKTAIQDLVKRALRSIYYATTPSDANEGIRPPPPLARDTYTAINRHVSRKLYQAVGSAENFFDSSAGGGDGENTNHRCRSVWQALASWEVKRALQVRGLLRAEMKRASL